MSARNLVIGVALAMSAAAGGQQPSVQLYAAGSLRAPMTEIVQAYSASGGPVAIATYGASGLLRERIEKGEPADVFASADVGNPQALARAGRATAPVVFARNRLCALLAPDMAAISDTLLDRMLDSRVKRGTSRLAFWQTVLVLASESVGGASVMRRPPSRTAGHEPE